MTALSEELAGVDSASVAPLPSLKARHVLGYGVSEYGIGLFLGALQLVWLFYLTDVVGVPPTTAGLIMLASLVWDGLIDPSIGLLVDRTRTRWGRYRPYLMFGAPMCSLALVAVFYKPDFGLQGAVIFALIGAMAFRTAYAFLNVPHNTLLAVTTPDSRQRATLAGSKMLFGGLAGVTVSAAIMPVLKGAGVGDEAGRFLIAAIVGAVAATLCVWVAVAAFADVDRPNTGEVVAHRIDFRDMVAVLKDNVPLYIVFGVWVAAILTLPTFSKALIYFAKYDLKDEAWAGAALTIMHIGQMGSIPVWAWLANRLPKAGLVQAAFLLSAAVLVTLMFSTTHDRMVLDVLVFLEGVAIGGSFGVAMSMVPDLVEYTELRTGRPVRAGIFGFHVFAVKVGNGLGVGLFGVMLAQVGFVANQVQTPATLHGIRLLMTGLPLAGSIAAILALFFYRIDHDAHAGMAAEVRARGLDAP